MKNPIKDCIVNLLNYLILFRLDLQLLLGLLRTNESFNLIPNLAVLLINNFKIDKVFEKI